MALYSRDGMWHWRKMISGHKFDRTTKTGNKKEAERIAAQWEADAVREIQIMGNRPMDLHACIKAFLSAQTGQSGAENAEVQLRHFLAIPDCRMGDVKLSQLQKVIEKRRAAGISHNTLVVCTSYWNAVVNFAEKQRWSKAPKLPAMKFIKTRLRYLSDDEEAALFVVIDPMGTYPGKCARTDKARQDNTDLLIALLDLGCRYHEAAQMRWSQVDFVSGKVEVIRGKGGVDSTLLMSKRFRAVLEKRFAVRTDEYIFPTKRKFNNNYKWLADALTRASIDTSNGRITLHTLRHTFATRMLKAGVSLVELQSLLGHKHISSTMIYAHFELSALAEKAVRILDQRQVEMA